MNGLISRIREEEAATMANAWKRYVELLEKVSFEQAEVAEMKATMQKLGRSSADLDDDAKAIRTCRELQRKIEAGRAAQPEMEKAINVANEYVAETTRISEQRKAEYIKLYSVGSFLENTWRAGSDGEMALNALLRSKPQLLKALLIDMGLKADSGHGAQIVSQGRAVPISEAFMKDAAGKGK